MGRSYDDRSAGARGPVSGGSLSVATAPEQGIDAGDERQERATCLLSLHVLFRSPSFLKAIVLTEQPHHLVAGLAGRKAAEARHQRHLEIREPCAHLGPKVRNVTSEAAYLTPEAAYLFPEAAYLFPEAAYLFPEAADLTPEAADVAPKAADVAPKALEPGASLGSGGDEVLVQRPQRDFRRFFGHHVDRTTHPGCP